MVTRTLNPWICLGQKCLKLNTRGHLLFQVLSMVGLVDGVIEKRVYLLYFSPTLDLTVITGVHTPENVSRVCGRV